jgi:hypothetical protein
MASGGRETAKIAADCATVKIAGDREAVNL